MRQFTHTIQLALTALPMDESVNTTALAKSTRVKVDAQRSSGTCVRHII